MDVLAQNLNLSHQVFDNIFHLHFHFDQGMNWLWSKSSEIWFFHQEMAQFTKLSLKFWLPQDICPGPNIISPFDIMKDFHRQVNFAVWLDSHF